MRIIISVLLSLIFLNVDTHVISNVLIEKMKDKFHAKNYEAINEPTVKRKKNYILCNVLDRTKNSCFSDSFNFTFSAVFHDKNLDKPSVLKHLAQTLGEYSTCEIRHMKYESINSTLRYFNDNEAYLWYEGKLLNTTFRPEVFISQSNENNYRKVTFKCSVPKSDVEMSIFGVSSGYKPIQSRPSSDYQTTVSAIHVKLNFMHIENINIYSNKYSSSESDNGDISRQFSTQNLVKQSSEKYLIYYDGKCKNCLISQSFYEPNVTKLTCLLKENTCVADGKCYLNREKSSVWRYTETPDMNMFVCRPEFSQTELYMPCAENNGGCKM